MHSTTIREIYLGCGKRSNFYFLILSLIECYISNQNLPSRAGFFVIAISDSVPSPCFRLGQGKKQKTMISNYYGHYSYNSNSISRNAIDKIGVYYCGYIGKNGKLSTLYVGRAAGDGVTIRSRLFDHLNNNRWPDVSHFGFRVCDTKSEAIDLEAKEIARLKPKYNSIGK